MEGLPPGARKQIYLYSKHTAQSFRYTPMLSACPKTPFATPRRNQRKLHLQTDIRGNDSTKNRNS